MPAVGRTFPEANATRVVFAHKMLRRKGLLQGIILSYAQ